METDSQLLSAWQAGDRDAGQKLVQRHVDALYRFFRTKTPGDAEDLVQRTFLDCFEAMEHQEFQSFRGFLFTVAHRRLVDHLRQHFRRGSITDPLEHSVEGLGTSPTQRVAKDQRNVAVLAALHRLPISHQIAVELFYWEELSCRELAEILDINEKTVRSRLTKARFRLREDLGASFVESLALGRRTFEP